MIKIPFKKIAIIAVLFLSVAGNIYFFGKQWFDKKLTERFNAGVLYVFEQAKKLGQVSLETKDGKIILILSK